MQRRRTLLSFIWCCNVIRNIFEDEIRYSDEIFLSGLISCIQLKAVKFLIYMILLCQIFFLIFGTDFFRVILIDRTSLVHTMSSRALVSMFMDLNAVLGKVKWLKLKNDIIQEYILNKLIAEIISGSRCIVKFKVVRIV